MAWVGSLGLSLASGGQQMLGVLGSVFQQVEHFMVTHLTARDVMKLCEGKRQCQRTVRIRRCSGLSIGAGCVLYSFKQRFVVAAPRRRIQPALIEAVDERFV